MIRSSRFPPRLLQGRSLGRRLRCSRKSLIQTCLNQEVFRQLKWWNNATVERALQKSSHPQHCEQVVWCGIHLHRFPSPNITSLFFQEWSQRYVSALEGLYLYTKLSIFHLMHSKIQWIVLFGGSEKWVTKFTWVTSYCKWNNVYQNIERFS